RDTDTIPKDGLIKQPYETNPAGPALPFIVAPQAILLFTTMDPISKPIPNREPTTKLVAFPFTFAIPLWFLVKWRMAAEWPTLSSWKANAPRGVLNVVSILLFFTALRRLPFAEALTLGYLAPLMLALMAAFVLNERLRPGVLGAVSLGLCGVGVIAWNSIEGQPVVTGDLIRITAAFGSAVTYATNNLMLHSQAQRESAISIVLIQHV